MTFREGIHHPVLVAVSLELLPLTHMYVVMRVIHIDCPTHFYTVEVVMIPYQPIQGGSRVCQISWVCCGTDILILQLQVAMVMTWFVTMCFILITVVAEPPFAYCPSSCYGNLLHGTSGEVGISIDSLFYSLIPHPHNHTYPHPHTYAVHESHIPVVISWITAVNLNEARLSTCVCVSVQHNIV